MKKKLESNLQAEIVKFYTNTYCTKLNKPRHFIFGVQNELSHELSMMISGKLPLMLRNVVKTSLNVLLSKAISMGMRNGVSDLIVLQPKRIVFVELKSAVGKQREQQKEFEGIVTALGFEYYVIRDLETFKHKICI